MAHMGHINYRATGTSIDGTCTYKSGNRAISGVTLIDQLFGEFTPSRRQSHDLPLDKPSFYRFLLFRVVPQTRYTNEDRYTEERFGLLSLSRECYNVNGNEFLMQHCIAFNHTVPIVDHPPSRLDWNSRRYCKVFLRNRRPSWY